MDVQFQELMSYYHLDFIVYYCIALIFVINTFKIVKLVQKTQSKYLFPYDILISVILIFATLAGLIFQGALTDIYLNQKNIWVYRLFVIFGVEVVLFIIQLIFIIKNYKKNKDDFGN